MGCLPLPRVRLGLDAGHAASVENMGRTPTRIRVRDHDPAIASLMPSAPDVTVSPRLVWIVVRRRSTGWRAVERGRTRVGPKRRLSHLQLMEIFRRILFLYELLMTKR